MSDLINKTNLRNAIFVEEHVFMHKTAKTIRFTLKTRILHVKLLKFASDSSPEHYHD